MRSEEITPDNVAAVEWDEKHFKYCTFSRLDMSGHTVCSDFIGCTFENIYWYWGLFTGANFIDCRFNECTFAGTAFRDTRFIDCKLANCNFTDDNLASPCGFENGVAYGCTIVNCTGFDLPITGAPHHLGSVT